MKEEEAKPEKDKCLLCGKETPYYITTHINLRIGYIEGGGQGCFQPQTCDDQKFYQSTKKTKND